MILLELEKGKEEIWIFLIVGYIKCPYADVLKPAHIMKNAFPPSSNVLAVPERKNKAPVV
jgi:hypothetical protein